MCPDLQNALKILSQPPYDQSIEHVYIVGGYGVYKVEYIPKCFFNCVPKVFYLLIVWE